MQPKNGPVARLFKYGTPSQGINQWWFCGLEIFRERAFRLKGREDNVSSRQLILKKEEGGIL
jgi:hypothetical protein